MAKQNENLQIIMSIVDKLTDKMGTQNLAIILMLIENVLWPMGFIYVSDHNFSPFQTSLIRGVSICFTHIIICLFLGISIDVKDFRDFRHLTMRNTLVIIHQIIYASMYFVISFPLNNCILLTSPLFAFVIDYYMNGVKINRTQVFGVILGFAGVFININGDYLMKLINPLSETHTTYQNYYITDIGLKILFSFIAFLSNAIWGFAVVSQKKISYIPGIKISLHLGFQFTILSGLAFCFGIVEPIEISEIFYGCIFSGLVMSACQIIFISALNLTKNTGKITILQLFCGVSSYAISFFKYQQEINWISIVGLFIMGYGLYRTVFLTSKD